MRIKKIRLENVGPFPSWEREFGPGVTAIVGPNGSGKSTLLQSMYAALTNDFGRSYGVKTDTISLAADPSAAASVRLLAEHAGAELAVERRLRPAGSELRICAPGTSDRTIRKADDIAAELEQILGLPLSFLGDYVFVDQWSIFSWMEMPPAERARAFQRLFRTDVAERCWEAAGAALAALPPAAVPVDDDLRRSLQDALDQLTNSRNRCEQAAAALAPASDVLRWQTDANDARKQQELRKRRDALQQRLETLQPLLLGATAQFDAAAQVLEEGQKRRADHVAAAAAARGELAAWSVYRQAKQAYNDLARLAARLQSEQRVEPQAVSAEWLSATEQELVNSSSELRNISAFLDTFDPASGRSACPTCGTPTDALRDKYASYQQLAAELRPAADALVQLIKEAQASQLARVEFETWRYNRNKQLEWCEQRMSEISVPEMPAEAEDALRSRIEAAQRDALGFAAVETAYRDCRQRRDREQAAVDEAQRQLDAAVAELAAISLDDAAGAAAEAKLREQELRERQAAALSSECGANQLAYDRLKQLVDDKEAAAQKTAVRAAWESRLIEVRNVLHRESLPRIVAQNYLEALESDVNDLLSLFDAPFRVRAQEGLSFWVRKHSGEEHDMRRLSGGQKVVLALAFRMAVNTMFADDLGLLCLDEPTAGLDRHNLGAFESAIARLQDMASSRGLQCLIVTHEEWLAHMFSSVVTLA